jgi:putative ABC transport system permease protein
VGGMGTLGAVGQLRPVTRGGPARWLLHLPGRALAAAGIAVHGVVAGGLRSVLSALGVAVAVASVVSLLAIGEGARQAVAAQFQTLGANVITVQSHSPAVQLTARDADQLRRRVPGLVAAVPVVGVAIPVRWRNADPAVGVLGVTPDLVRIRPIAMQAGRFLTPLEDSARLHVAVLGNAAYRGLFGFADPVGQQIWLGQAAFRVVGVLAPLGGSALGTGEVAALAGNVATGTAAPGGGDSGNGCTDTTGGSAGAGGSACGGANPQTTVAVGTGIDNDVLIPEGTAELLTASTQVSAIWLKATDTSAVAPAIAQSQRILALLHPAAAPGGGPLPGQAGFPGKFVGPGGCCPPPGGGQVVLPTGSGSGITVQSIDALAQQADQANRVLTLMLTAIAAVSLLVGGLGVMNIMLVAVRERTAEIGVRKAVGARGLDVVAQFLTEALLLAAIGGLCGWLASYAGIAALRHYGVHAVPVPGAAGAALLAAAAIGLVFGTYPAYVAATLEPVEALRRT